MKDETKTLIKGEAKLFVIRLVLGFALAKVIDHFWGEEN